MPQSASPEVRIYMEEKNVKRASPLSGIDLRLKSLLPNSGNSLPPNRTAKMVRLTVAMQLRASQFGPTCVVLVVMALVCPYARATEHVTLKNGFELDCVRRESVGDKMRLYLAG